MFGGFFSRRTDYELVAMATSDAAVAAHIHGQAFARAWNDGEFHSLLSQPAVFGSVACISGRAREAAAGFVLAREAAGESEILTIGVLPTHQRSGLGWRLMLAAMREAARRGAEELFLEVDESNVQAIGLYRKLGFTKVGERRGYYSKPGQAGATALVMRRELR